MIKQIIDSSQELRINLNWLNLLKNAVKNDFEKITDVYDILENFPFLKNDINDRIKNGILFQPGRIFETMVIQSIANHLNFVYIGNGIYDSDNYTLKQDGGSGKSDLIITYKNENKDYIFELVN